MSTLEGPIPAGSFPYQLRLSVILEADGVPGYYFQNRSLMKPVFTKIPGKQTKILSKFLDIWWKWYIIVSSSFVTVLRHRL